MSNLAVVYQTLSGNTKKVAEALAEGAETTTIRISEVNDDLLSKAEVVMLGSGIYGGLHHRQIIEVVERLNSKTKVFIFSTAGIPALSFIWHKALKKALAKRNIKVIGEVSYKGFDVFGPLKFLGGVNKKRPNEDDLNKARQAGRMFLDKTK